MSIEFVGDGIECEYDESLRMGVYHLDGVISDYTLCGVTMDSDPTTAGSFRVSSSAVNCKECVRIILHCRGVRVNTNEHR